MLSLHVKTEVYFVFQLYLDVYGDIKSLGLTWSITDVKAEDILADAGLADVLDVEDMVWSEVFYSEGDVRADHTRSTDQSCTQRTHLNVLNKCNTLSLSLVSSEDCILLNISRPNIQTSNWS